MSDLEKHKYPYIKVQGVWYSLEDVLIALGKALLKKGVITKQEILAEL